MHKSSGYGDRGRLKGIVAGHHHRKHVLCEPAPRNAPSRVCLRSITERTADNCLRSVRRAFGGHGSSERNMNLARSQDAAAGGQCQEHSAVCVCAVCAFVYMRTRRRKDCLKLPAWPYLGLAAFKVISCPDAFGCSLVRAHCSRVMCQVCELRCC